MAANAKVAEQLAERRLRMRYVYRPGQSRLVNGWDIVTTLALLYTASVTPFEVAFLTSRDDWTVWRDPLFLINRLLDVIFAADLLFQFLISYQTAPSATDAPRNSNDLWVDDRRLIAKRCAYILHAQENWAHTRRRLSRDPPPAIPAASYLPLPCPCSWTKAPPAR